MKHFILLVLMLATSFLAAQENTAITCSDGLDNDNDGLFDCQDPDCDALPNDGCQICSDDGLSFADVVISANNPCPNTLNADPASALGVSDFLNDGSLGEDSTYVSLGEEGILVLGFTNNLLINSGDDQPDLWIFEIGPNVEATFISLYPSNPASIVALSQNGVMDTDADGYFEFGTVEGALSSVDIDSFLPNEPAAGELTFSRVKLQDVPGASCNGDYPGADIDAVCALSSIPVASGLTDYHLEDLMLYPNPTTQWLNVPKQDANTIKFTLFDLSARSILNGMLNGPIDVGHLEAGSYSLMLENENGIVGFGSFVKD